MNPYSPEELTLIATGVDALLAPGTTFFLILMGPDKCGAICTAPPEYAEQIRAVLRELSQREPQFNN